MHLPGVFVGVQSLAAGELQGVHHLADHVELELRGSGVADADRPAALVARQPGDLPFGNAAFAGQAVEDLDLPRVAGHGPQQPVAPLAGFVVVSAADHGVEREGGVAEPAVAVVPVAGAAELLGQRGGGRGHHAPGRRVGQRFQRDQRADDGLAPGPVVWCSDRTTSATTTRCRPVPRRPESPGPRTAWEGCQVSVKGTRCAGADGELADGVKVLAAHSAPAFSGAGCRGRRSPAARRRSFAPRDDRAVVEAASPTPSSSAPARACRPRSAPDRDSCGAAA